MSLRLLISLPNWLGDAVLATGLLGGLARLKHPPLVDVCGNRVGLAVAGSHPVVRRAIPYERHGEHGSPGRFLALAHSLRGERYDAHLVLPPSFSAAAFAWFVRAPARAGFDGFGRRFLLTYRAVRGRRGSEHLLDEYRRLLGLLGLDAPAAEPEVMVSPEAAARAAELLAGAGLAGRPYGVIAPGATYGPTKRWPAERFARVAEALGERHGLAFVLVGGPGDGATRALVREVSPGFELVDLTGRTDLSTLAAVLARAAVVVANDSGPLHLARAVGAPAVGIFGSTEPRWTGPRGGVAVVAADRPPCAPCFRRTCEIGFVCLTRISAAEVVMAAESALAARAPAPTV